MAATDEEKQLQKRGLISIEPAADGEENFNVNETLEFTVKKMVPKIMPMKRKQRDTKYGFIIIRIGEITIILV
jgi:hypothetical protein